MEVIRSWLWVPALNHKDLCQYLSILFWKKPTPWTHWTFKADFKSHWKLRRTIRKVSGWVGEKARREHAKKTWEKTDSIYCFNCMKNLMLTSGGKKISKRKEGLYPFVLVTGPKSFIEYSKLRAEKTSVLKRNWKSSNHRFVILKVCNPERDTSWHFVTLRDVY